MEERAGVEHDGAVGEELMASAGERRDPHPLFWVVMEAIPTRAWRQDADCGGTDIGSLAQDHLHPGVGLEGLAFLDANGGQQAEEFRVLAFGWLCLDDLVDFLEDPVVHAMNGVVEHAGDIDELDLWRVVRLRQRVDREDRLGGFDGRSGAAVQLESTPDHPVPLGVRACHVVALRHFTSIPRGEDQKLAALAFVGARVAEDGHAVEPVIIDDAKGVGRRLDDHGLVLELEPHFR